MSDPNQPPYGAVPPPPPPSGPPGPPSGPPSGPPPGFPPPAGPPFGAPPGPAPAGPGGGRGGKGNGLLIALAVLGVLALVGVIIGLVLVLTGDDDDDGDDGKGKDPGTSGAAPDKVVESLLDAAGDGDCNQAKTFLTSSAQAADPCNAAEFRLLASGDVDSDVGDPQVDGAKASVPVHFDNDGNVQDYVFNLEQVDGAWLVASYAIAGPTGAGTTPTDPTSPTDGASVSTDDPSSTDGPAPGGTSTADAVANEPAAVVEAFMKSVLSGDCATAEDLVTEAYLKEEGRCDASDLPSGFKVDYTVGSPKVNDAAGTATVPVDIDYAGTKETSTVKLEKVDGNWRISKFD